MGTGVEVWEVVRTFLEVDRDWNRLVASYDWLTEVQLAAALDYAKEHAGAIEARIQEHYAHVPEALRPKPELHWG